MVEAFEDVYDHTIVFHGYAEYARDYDVFVYLSADPRSGIRPEHRRCRFTHCVHAQVTTMVGWNVWKISSDDCFVNYQDWLDAGEPSGWVWGTNSQVLYPGMSLVEDSAQAQLWQERIGIPFFEAVIETEVHEIKLIFADLVVSEVEAGWP